MALNRSYLRTVHLEFPLHRCPFQLSRFVLFLAVSLVALWPLVTAAQTTADDVHIIPHQQVHAKTEDGNRTPRLQVGSIVKDVNLVLVPVTVTDDLGGPVTGLEKQNFAVYEREERQQVQYFSSEDAPISIGILFDASGSMSDKMQEAREAIAQFLNVANPEDEFFLISFSNRPELLSDFTRSSEDVLSKLMFVAPHGATALHDAIYLGLTKASQSYFSKRALLIISDGGDNHSRYSEKEVMRFAKEADTPIYAVGIHTMMGTREERLGPWMLQEMTEATGGRHFTIKQSKDLLDVTTKIGYQLRNRYVLGYRPTNPASDGKWHKIKVKLELPQGAPHLTPYAKTGYYAATQ